MRMLVFICSLISMCSCGHSSSNSNNELSQKEVDTNPITIMTKTDTTKIKLSKGIEKITIEYWDNYYANNFIFNILSSDAESKITYKGETLFTEERTLKDPVTYNRLITYINQFYIDKTDNIILKKSKSNKMLVTDYPHIRVIGYQNKKEVFNVNTQIGEEEYDIEYHSEFVKFYKFLDGLVKEKYNIL